jgi:hypothetical protein
MTNKLKEDVTMKKTLIIAATTVGLGILAYALKIHEKTARVICKLNDKLFK